MTAALVAQTGGFSFSPGTSIIALFIPLLLVVPGLVAVRLGLWTARRENPFTQLESLVVSALVSLASLFVLYAGLSVWYWRPIIVGDIQGQSLPWFVIGYGIHIAIAACTGMALGSFAYNYVLDNEARSRYDPWQYVFRQLTESATIEVRTTSGLWVRGHLTKAEASTGTRDLLLTSVDVLNHTVERTPADPVERDAEGPGEEVSTPDSGLAGSGGETESPQADTQTKDSGGAFWENIDEGKYFETNEEVIEALERDSAGYVQIDGSAVEAVRVPNGPDVNTEEVYEELSDTDRVHKRAALLGDEFGYFKIEGRLRNYCAHLNHATSRWALLFLFWMVTLVVTVGSIGGAGIGGSVGVQRAVLAWSALLTGMSCVELLRYYPESQIRGAKISHAATAIISFATGVLAIKWWIVRDLGVVFDVAAVFAGLCSGVLVSTVLIHLREEYTTTAALAVSIAATSLLALISFASFRVVLEPVIGQALLLVTVASSLGLFCERIRVGEAGEYEDWATVLADSIAMGLAIGAAGLILWSSGLISYAGFSGVGIAAVLCIISVLAGGAAFHGVSEAADHDK
jgi:hypothetical protein